MDILRRFLLTISYVTSLPVGRGKFYEQYYGGADGADDPFALAGLAKYLPAAGLLIGFLLLGIAALGLMKLKVSVLVTGAILTVAWIAITGGLHFDGLMDTADGVFSHRNRERILEIMMDSRVGNFGAITGMAVLILKFAALANLCEHPQVLFPMLVLAPAWARWCELYTIGRFPYAKPEGKGKIWHDSTRVPVDFFTGMMPPLIVSSALAGIYGIQPILMIAIFALICGLVTAHYLGNVIAGQTGDTYGAVVELSETGCLLLCTLFCHLQ